MMFAQEGASAHAGRSLSGSDAMKFMMLVATALVASPAISQGMAYVDVPVQGRENVSYAYADVLRANPTYDIIRTTEQREECVELPAPAADAAAADDAVADAASTAVAVDLATNGNGSDNGEGAVTLVANQLSDVDVASPARRDCRMVEAVREDRRISGYDVEYRYKGQLYMSSMDHDPGNKLRIRVTVAPAD